MENFKPYSNLEAQEEAEKLQEKVRSGKASSYNEAERLIDSEPDLVRKKIESGEARTENEARALIDAERYGEINREKDKEEAKKMIRHWHDEIMPDYIFFLEGAAIPSAFLLKEAWKHAYPNEMAPMFLRFDPHLPGDRDKLPEYLKNIVKKKEAKIIVVDNQSGNPTGVSRLIYANGERVYHPNDGTIIGGTLSGTCVVISNELRKANVADVSIYATPSRLAPDGFLTVYEKEGSLRRRYISRRPTSRVLSSRSSGRNSTEDESQRGGRANFKGRIVRHPQQKKRAMSWIKQLKETGKEAGEELKKEIETRKTKE